MHAQDAVDLSRNALVMALLIGSPVLVVGMVVGLIIGLLQALTQIQDQTIAFVPKIVAMIAALGLALPWLIHQMVQYSHDLFLRIPITLGGG
jgi:flagellar biosynthetic protein FliQ